MRILAVLLCIATLSTGCLGIGGKDQLPPPDDDVMPAASAEAEQESGETPPTPTPAPSSEPAKPSPAASTSTSASPPASPAPPAPPRIDVLAWNGTITGAGASPPAGPACCVWRNAQSENTDASFDVPAGIKGLVVELAWTDAAIDLDLQVLGGDYVETIPPDPAAAEPSTHTGHAWSMTEGTPGAPDGHARLVLTDAEALVTGTWAWRVGAKGGASAIPFSVHVSLFHDTTPAEDYTAAGGEPSGQATLK